nr:type II toxin-antitoxin system PemK/MazF family toxin [Pseudomonas syringae]
MAPEIRKRRMVVVLNGRLPNGCTLVVPISSSGNPNAVHRGMHVFLLTCHFAPSRNRPLSVSLANLPMTCSQPASRRLRIG